MFAPISAEKLKCAKFNQRENFEIGIKKNVQGLEIYCFGVRENIQIQGGTKLNPREIFHISLRQSARKLVGAKIYTNKSTIYGNLRMSPRSSYNP